MILRKCFFVGTLAGLAFLMASCAVSVDSRIGADASAHVQMQIRIYPPMQAYLSDLAGMGSGDSSGAAGGTDDGMLSATAIRDRLTQQKGLSTIKVEGSLSQGLSVALDADNLGQVLKNNGNEVQGVMSIVSKGQSSQLSIRIDRKAVQAFLALGMKDSETQGLLPQDPKTTAKQYQAQLEWALDEYGTAAQRAEMFQTAAIHVTIALPRPVISANGFTVVDKQAGKIGMDLGLLDILTLQRTLQFDAVY